MKVEEVVIVAKDYTSVEIFDSDLLKFVGNDGLSVYLNTRTSKTHIVFDSVAHLNSHGDLRLVSFRGKFGILDLTDDSLVLPVSVDGVRHFSGAFYYLYKKKEWGDMVGLFNADLKIVVIPVVLRHLWYEVNGIWRGLGQNGKYGLKKQIGA